MFKVPKVTLRGFQVRTFWSNWELKRWNWFLLVESPGLLYMVAPAAKTKTLGCIPLPSLVRISAQTRRDPPKRLEQRRIRPLSRSQRARSRQRCCLFLVWAEATGPGPSQPSP